MQPLSLQEKSDVQVLVKIFRDIMPNFEQQELKAAWWLLWRLPPISEIRSVRLQMRVAYNEARYMCLSDIGLDWPHWRISSVTLMSTIHLSTDNGPPEVPVWLISIEMVRLCSEVICLRLSSIRIRQIWRNSVTCIHISIGLTICWPIRTSSMHIWWRWERVAVWRMLSLPSVRVTIHVELDQTRIPCTGRWLVCCWRSMMQLVLII